MSNYALVKDGFVINTIVWDGPEIAPMEFDEGVEAVEYKDDVSVSIGYAYSDGNFIQPEPTQEEIDADNQRKKVNNVSYKQYLLSTASENISILQDAVDLEMATEDEAAKLVEWKKYRVLLSRIDANTEADIEWPEKPV